MKRLLDVYDLGKAEYRPVWDLQKRAQKLLIKKKRGELSGSEELNDILFFVEHPHVYTLGKSGDSAHLLKTLSELSKIDAEYIEIDRGGDITYHGPGQIVGYPILDLDQHFTDIHKYLRYLEEVIIRTCADFGVKAGRIEGLTGVWAGDEKICAMGIRCSRWVTMHGFALNVNTDLSYFKNIVPCGIDDKEVTSLSECTGRYVSEEDVKKKILKHFAEVFDVEINKQDSVPEPYLQFSYL
ncbi:MAG: lipoyl(octanoyl) transferase LipB [Balneolaceae bacterium]|nr:lipoyl(octanoyl) transferase LipB [Balneolaceae bacterium]